MKIKTEWPLQTSWGVEIIIETGKAKITYMVDSEDEANSLANQLTDVLSDLESFIKSCDSKD